MPTGKNEPWWKDEKKLTKKAAGYLFHDLSSLRHFVHKASCSDDWAAMAGWEKAIELKDLCVDDTEYSVVSQEKVGH